MQRSQNRSKALRSVAVLTALALATAVLVAPAHAGSAVHQRSAVYSFHNELAPVPDASATLVRNANGVGFTIDTSALQPGHAYTVWWIIFNHPEYCTDPLLPGLQCGIGDLDFPEFGLHGDPRVQATILRAGGHVVGGNGRAGFGGSLTAGERSDTVIGPGLLNVQSAEVYLDVLDHGAKSPPQNVDNQIHTFITEPGSCNSYCADDQVAGFAGMS